MFIKFITDRAKQTYVLVQVDSVINVDRMYRNELESVDENGNIICAFDSSSWNSHDVRVVFRDSDYDYSETQIVSPKRTTYDILSMLTFCIDENNKNVSWLSELPVYIMNDSGSTIEKLI